MYIYNFWQVLSSHSINFFKDAGEIEEVRFAVRENQFAGYGNVEFSTVEAAQEVCSVLKSLLTSCLAVRLSSFTNENFFQALKLNNKMLKGRPVTVDLAKEKGAFSPGSRYDFFTSIHIKVNCLCIFKLIYLTLAMKSHSKRESKFKGLCLYMGLMPVTVLKTYGFFLYIYFC